MGQGNAATDKLIPDLQKILNRKELRVAMHKFDRPPFFMELADGSLGGIDVELAREIGAFIGVPVRFIRTANSFDEVVDQVADGRADVAISKLSMTGSRAQKIIFSTPYFKMRKAFLLNRIQLEKLGKKKPLHEILNDPQAKIGMVGKSSYESFTAQTFPKATRVPMDDWDSGLVPKVLSGELTGLYRDEFEVWRSLSDVKDGALYLVSVVLKDEMDPLSVAVSADAPGLLSVINLYVTNFYDPLTIEDVQKRARPYMTIPTVPNKMRE